MITCQMITQVTSAYYGLPVREIHSMRRAAPLVRARHMGWYLARHMTDRSYPQIAQAMGKRDHSTVQHGIHMMERRITLNPEICAEARAVGDRLIRLELMTPSPEPLSTDWEAAELLRSSYAGLLGLATAVTGAFADIDSARGSVSEKAAQIRLNKTLTALRNHLSMEKSHA